MVHHDRTSRIHFRWWRPSLSHRPSNAPSDIPFWLYNFMRPCTSRRRLPPCPLIALVPLKCSSRILQFPHIGCSLKGENALVPLHFQKRSVHVWLLYSLFSCFINASLSLSCLCFVVIFRCCSIFQVSIVAHYCLLRCSFWYSLCLYEWLLDFPVVFLNGFIVTHLSVFHYFKFRLLLTILYYILCCLSLFPFCSLFIFFFWSLSLNILFPWSSLLPL